MPHHLFDAPRREFIEGFHGTCSAGAATILSHGFQRSTGDGEWLGHGVYFWDNADAAWFWAERCHGKKAAVLKATLVLGYCLDLDSPAILQDLLSKVRRELEATCEKEGKMLPENEGSEHRLHCAVLNLAAEHTFPPTDSIIRTCPSGAPVFAGSDILSETRRQICIRTLTNIHHPTREYRRNS